MKTSFRTVKSFSLAALVFSQILAHPQNQIERGKGIAQGDLPQPGRSLKVALLVGVGDYPRSSGFHPLQYSIADVVDVDNVLQSEGYVVYRLKDRDATASSIRDLFQNLVKVVIPNEGTFLFYFSGHGARIKNENYLATYGTTTHDLPRQGIGLSELQALLSATGAGQRMAFIDACRDDVSLKSTSTEPFSNFPKAKGIRIIYSGAPGEVSYEDPELHHGVFSFFIIQGLQGDAARNGLITFESLYDFVSGRMLQYGAKKNRIQTPYQSGDSGPGVFLIAEKPTTGQSGEGSAVSAPSDSPAPGGLPKQTEHPSTDPRIEMDPPGRVGRLSFAEEQFAIRPAGLKEWAKASVNRPITTGDRLWVGNVGHMELQIGNAVVRLGPNTEVSLLSLTDKVAQFELSQGMFVARVRNQISAERFEVDTPTAAISLKSAGLYRFQASESEQKTTVVVGEGSAEVFNGSRMFPMQAKQAAEITRGQAGAPAVYKLINFPASDTFDRWCSSRDLQDDKSTSTKYVPEHMVGREDLDENGTWQPVRGYGIAWMPNVDSQWEPYRHGHWIWIDPWGWTWVDDSPWGFAPFHYGRWLQIGGKWAWLPGGSGGRQAYAPALVAWATLAEELAEGGELPGDSIGWFPLGPGEFYMPPYSAGPASLNFMKVAGVDVGTVNGNSDLSKMAYLNRSHMTAVSKNDFVSVAPVATAMRGLTQLEKNRAAIVNFPAVAPQKSSLLGQPADTVNVEGPPTIGRRHFVVALNTPPPPPLPFSQREPLFANNPGRPLSLVYMQRLRSQLNASASNSTQPSSSHPSEVNKPASESEKAKEGRDLSSKQRPQQGGKADKQVPAQTQAKTRRRTQAAPTTSTRDQTGVRLKRTTPPAPATKPKPGSS